MITCYAEGLAAIEYLSSRCCRGAPTGEFVRRIAVRAGCGNRAAICEQNKAKQNVTENERANNGTSDVSTTLADTGDVRVLLFSQEPPLSWSRPLFVPQWPWCVYYNAEASGV